jgi:hypothetical protein
VIEIEISAKFAGMYQREKSMLDFLITSEVPRRVLLRRYQLLINEGTIKIEDLPDDEKKKLVSQCRATGLRFTNESLRDAARILHTLKTISA